MTISNINILSGNAEKGLKIGPSSCNKMPKTSELLGAPPLDPRQGRCPWTPPGPLSGPLDPTPLYAMLYLCHWFSPPTVKNVPRALMLMAILGLFLKILFCDIWCRGGFRGGAAVPPLFFAEIVHLALFGHLRQCNHVNLKLPFCILTKLLKIWNKWGFAYFIL